MTATEHRTFERDDLTEWSDALRWAMIVLVGAVSAYGAIRWNILVSGGRPLDGMGWWLALNACMYRRKWRRAVGLPLWPRWSRSRV